MARAAEGAAVMRNTGNLTGGSAGVILSDSKGVTVTLAEDWGYVDTVPGWSLAPSTDPSR